MVEKYEKDGQVAVLVSHGFGAGWSTWNSSEANPQALMFDPDMVQAILAGHHEKAEMIAKLKYPDTYTGGVEDLVVEWVNKGDRFEITEYDGNESLRVFGPDDGFTA